MGKSEALLLASLWLFIDRCQGNTDIVSAICFRVPTLWFCKPPASEPPEILRPIPPPVPPEFSVPTKKSSKFRRLKAERILRETAEERRALHELERLDKARLARKEINRWKKIRVDGPDFWKQFIPEPTQRSVRKITDSLMPFPSSAFSPIPDFKPSPHEEIEADPPDFQFFDVPDAPPAPASELPEGSFLIQDYCATYEFHFRTYCFGNIDRPGDLLKKIYKFCIGYENACIRQVFDQPNVKEIRKISGRRAKREVPIHGIDYYDLL